MANTVYFCTNRVLSGPNDQSGSYTVNIQTQTDATGLLYGTAFIDGSDLTDNSGWTVSSIQDVAQGDFLPNVAGDLAKPGRNLLLFLHGFDNSFSDALTRAAFNRAWMSASNIPTADTTVIAFSWPSLGKTVGFPILQSDYLHDQNMARWSGYHCMTFFSRLEPLLTAARQSGCRTYLLAHSMGHLLLSAAVESWFLNGNGPAALFNATFLAAGDCVADAFAHPMPAQLSDLTQLTDRVSIFYSHADDVLKLSEVVNLGAPRLGQDGPLNRSDLARFPAGQFTMTDATNLADYAISPLSSHQYYRMSPTARKWITSQMV